MPNDLRRCLPFVTSAKYKNNDPDGSLLRAQPSSLAIEPSCPLTVDCGNRVGHVRLGTVLMRTYDELI